MFTVILPCVVTKVGFQSVQYTVVEGEDVMVTLCVVILYGRLTNAISLEYSLSVHSQTAAGNDYWRI